MRRLFCFCLIKLSVNYCRHILQRQHHMPCCQNNYLQRTAQLVRYLAHTTVSLKAACLILE